MLHAEKVSAKEAYLEGFKGSSDWRAGTTENHSTEEGSKYSLPNKAKQRQTTAEGKSEDIH